jgi:hypothetical protein
MDDATSETYSMFFCEGFSESVVRYIQAVAKAKRRIH